jgi:hypothetical protein
MRKQNVSMALEATEEFAQQVYKIAFFEGTKKRYLTLSREEPEDFIAWLNSPLKNYAAWKKRKEK